MTRERTIESARPAVTSWGGVYALSLCAATLIASEFMPVSLLTPVAHSLAVTEGQAGQAISMSGIFAVVTSLLIAPTTARLDRRILLLCLTALMMASGLVVSLAPTYAVFIAGRALVGVVIGGFWSMSAATVMRLVPPRDIPRGLAILNGGNALATTVAAPLGSFLGQYVGWRGAFSVVVPVAAMTFLWLTASLPAMPSREQPDAKAALRIVRRPQVALGMTGAALFFLGQFALFTYLRPFLETVTQVSVPGLSALLLVLGVSGLLGTFGIGRLLGGSVYGVLVAMALTMAVLAIGLILLGHSVIGTTVLLALWGLVGTAAPVAWWTWLSRVLPDNAEAGGGIMVAVVQLAITAGASGGGLLYDWDGAHAAFALSSAALCACAVVTGVAACRGSPRPRTMPEGSEPGYRGRAV